MKYRKVDSGDGGIRSKSIADVSCSFCSNVIFLHPLTNQWQIWRVLVDIPIIDIDQYSSYRLIERERE